MTEGNTVSESPVFGEALAKIMRIKDFRGVNLIEQEIEVPDLLLAFVYYLPWFRKFWGGNKRE